MDYLTLEHLPGDQKIDQKMVEVKPPCEFRQCRLGPTVEH